MIKRIHPLIFNNINISINYLRFHNINILVKEGKGHKCRGMDTGAPFNVRAVESI